LLANGYPHPDFGIIYGLGNSLSDLIASYQSHLKLFERYCYEITDIEPKAIYALATLYLNDRAIKTEYLGPQGSLIVEDLSSYYDVVESLISQLGFPALWLQSVLVYFDLHMLKTAGAGKDLFLETASFEYGGISWATLIAELRRKEWSLGDTERSAVDPTVEAAAGDILPESSPLKVVLDENGKRGVVVKSRQCYEPIKPASSHNPEIELCNTYTCLICKSYLNDKFRFLLTLCFPSA
jgi:hypothetical protein